MLTREEEYQNAGNVYGEQHPSVPVPPPRVDFGIFVDSLSPRSISSCIRSSTPLSIPNPPCTNQSTKQHTIPPIIIKFPLHHIRPQHLRHLLSIFNQNLCFLTSYVQVPVNFKSATGFGESCVEDVVIAYISPRLASNHWFSFFIEEGWQAQRYCTLKGSPSRTKETTVSCECHCVCVCVCGRALRGFVWVGGGLFFEVEFCCGSAGRLVGFGTRVRNPFFFLAMF